MSVDVEKRLFSEYLQSFSIKSCYGYPEVIQMDIHN